MASVLSKSALMAQATCAVEDMGARQRTSAVWPTTTLENLYDIFPKSRFFTFSFFTVMNQGFENILESRPDLKNFLI